MQPSVVPRRKYPDQCIQEQDCLGQFAKFGLAGEQTDDKGSSSDSSHAKEFQFGVGFKGSGHCILDGGSIISSLDVGSSD